jgi:uncharacterized protein YtpQ (UPF0354 family)
VGLIWKRSLSKKKFRDRFTDVLKKKYTSARFELIGELTIVMADFSEFESVHIELDNAYKEFEENPKDIDNIIKKFLFLIDDQKKPRTEGFDVSKIFPVIRARSWITDLQSEYGHDPKNIIVWFDDYNDDLVLAYVEIQSEIRFLTTNDIKTLEETQPNFKQIALDNLRRRTADKHVIGESGVYLIGGDGNLDASLLLDSEVFDDKRIQITGDRIIGVPSRNFLVVAGGGMPFNVFRAAAMVSQFHKAEPYPISGKLFVQIGDLFQPLDSGLDDETHAIPHIDVVDVHVKSKSGGSKLLIVIVSPLKADARSIFRFFLKLDGYLDYISSDAYKAEYGAPHPDSTSIEVKIHPDSDDEVVTLIGSLAKWVQERNASLEVVRTQRMN